MSTRTSFPTNVSPPDLMTMVPPLASPPPPAAVTTAFPSSTVPTELLREMDPPAPCAAPASMRPLTATMGPWSVTLPALPLDTLTSIVPSLRTVPERVEAATLPPLAMIVPLLWMARASPSPAPSVTRPPGLEIVPLLRIPACWPAPATAWGEPGAGAAPGSTSTPSMRTYIRRPLSRTYTSLPMTMVTSPPSEMIRPVFSMRRATRAASCALISPSVVMFPLSSVKWFTPARKSESESRPAAAYRPATSTTLVRPNITPAGLTRYTIPLAVSAPSMRVGVPLWMRLSTRAVALGWMKRTDSAALMSKER